jgi:hypothetical protein
MQIAGLRNMGGDECPRLSSMGAGEYNINYSETIHTLNMKFQTRSR